MEKAAHCMDEARSLDTADRYVNCKCAKYQLRANQVPKAEDTCGLFTRVSIKCKSSDVMLCMYSTVNAFHGKYFVFITLNFKCVHERTRQGVIQLRSPISLKLGKKVGFGE